MKVPSEADMGSMKGYDPNLGIKPGKAPGMAGVNQGIAKAIGKVTGGKRIPRTMSKSMETGAKMLKTMGAAKLKK